MIYNFKGSSTHEYYYKKNVSDSIVFLGFFLKEKENLK